MLTKKFIFIISVLAIPCAFWGFYPKKDYPMDLVPNEETAKKITEVILTPIIGKANVDSAKPFVAILTSGNVWLVKDVDKPNQLGGDIIVEIQKSDCKILKVSIYK